MTPDITLNNDATLNEFVKEVTKYFEIVCPNARFSISEWNSINRYLSVQYAFWTDNKDSFTFPNSYTAWKLELKIASMYNYAVDRVSGNKLYVNGAEYDYANILFLAMK